MERKNCKKENHRTYGIIAILVLSVTAIMVMIYIINFWNSPISNYSADWDAFGSYLGAITGLLAFVGVMWSMNANEKYNKNNIDLLKSQNKESSDRDLFFKLLDLHTNKFSNVEYIDNSLLFKATEAFKKYTEKANLYLKHIILYKYILGKIELGESIEDIENMYYNEYHKPNNIIKDNVLLCDKYNNVTSRIDELKKNIANNKIELFKYSIDSLVKIALIEKPLSDNEFYEYSRKAADIFYNKYGHITGHYFRNLYYAMKITNDFGDNDNYKKLLRAQISRYEIALNLYNALSSLSSVRMIELLEQYQIFDDQYKDDIYLLQILPEGIKYNDLLKKSKEYLKEKNRLGK